MRLEVLHAPARGAPRPSAVLFVHGICCGAEIWRPRFLQHFADAGFDSYAVSLRGHGASEGRGALAWTTLNDYAADLERTIARIDKPVAIVGHSMGGAVLQEHLRRGGRPAASVLMNSVPPYGLGAASMRLLFNAPGAWGNLAMANAFGFGVVDIARLQDVLAGPNVDPEAFRGFVAAAGAESPLVGFELQGWRPFAPEPWRTGQLPPLMVIGGSKDGLVPVSDLNATGAYYDAPVTVLEGVGHLPMIEPDWTNAADPIIDWLAGQAAGARAAA
ncbi:MAG: alpha/beta fold hydrolase [Pseudomonadota bacterium]